MAVGLKKDLFRNAQDSRTFKFQGVTLPGYKVRPKPNDKENVTLQLLQATIHSKEHHHKAAPASIARMLVSADGVSGEG